MNTATAEPLPPSPVVDALQRDDVAAARHAAAAGALAAHGLEPADSSVVVDVVAAVLGVADHEFVVQNVVNGRGWSPVHGGELIEISRRNRLLALWDKAHDDGWYPVGEPVETISRWIGGPGPERPTRDNEPWEWLVIELRVSVRRRTGG